jgi:hypothetical protein
LSQAWGLLALPASIAGEHAMRAAIIALMLMIGSQARAECDKKHDNDW